MIIRISKHWISQSIHTLGTLVFNKIILNNPLTGKRMYPSQCLYCNNHIISDAFYLNAKSWLLIFFKSSKCSFMQKIYRNSLTCSWKLIIHSKKGNPMKLWRRLIMKVPICICELCCKIVNIALCCGISLDWAGGSSSGFILLHSSYSHQEQVYTIMKSKWCVKITKLEVKVKLLIFTWSRFIT